MSYVCETRVAKWAKNNDHDVPRDIIRQMGKMLDEVKAQGLSDIDFQKKVEELYETHIEEYWLGKQINELRAIDISENAFDGISKADRSKPEGIYEAIRAWLTGGGIKGFLGSNRDIRDIRGTVMSEFVNTWKAGIGKLEKIAQTGALDKEIFQELHALRKGLPTGKSGSKMAVQAAQAIHNLQKLIYSKKAAHNALMRENSDYIMQRIHNREKIMAVDKATWVSDAMATYGKESYIEVPMDEKRKIFEGIYDNIVEGRHGEASDFGEYMRPHQRGQSDLYARMSAGRKFVADDWEKEFLYNQKYGYGTVLQTVHRTMRGAAHDVAVLQKFSALPRYVFEDLVARVMNSASDAEKQVLRSRMSDLEAQFNQAMGTADAQAYTNQAKWFNSIRAVEMMAHLGKTYLRVLPDIAVSALTLRGMNGRNVFENAFDIFGEYMKFFPSGAAREQALESLWMFSKTANGKFLDDIGAVDYSGFHGRLARTAQSFGKWNLMDIHTDAMKAATGIVAARHLKHYSGKTFGELEPQVQNFMKRYGVDNAEWYAIRQAGLDLGNGKQIIDSDAINKLDDSVIENYLEMTGRRLLEDSPANASMIAGARSELSTKVGTLINNMANIGSTTAGTRQAAFMFRGLDINTPEGMMRRALFQFQGAMYTTADAYRRAFVSGKTPKGDLAGVGQAVFLGSLLWSLGKFAENAIEGREQPAIDAKFAAEAVLGSGALGLAGDVLFSEIDANSPYDFAMRSAAGLTGPMIPTGLQAIGTTWQAGRSVLDLIREPDDREPTEFPAGDAYKLLTDHIPGRNMLYLKGVLDYYVFWEGREFFDEGYLGRLEERTRGENNLKDEPREYNFFAPTEATFLGADIR